MMGSAFHVALCQGTPRSAPTSEQGNKNDSDSVMTTPLASNKQKSKQRTPMRSVFTNPFEIGLTERLHLPAMSPSIFAQMPVTEEKERSFRWSIEQMAVLHPAEFDDVAISQDSVASGLDMESEQRAQEAINCFFSQRHIVPSPWLQCTPSHRSMSFSSSSQLTEATNLSNKVEKQDAYTQTTLTLPIDFDLEKLLGNYCTFQSEKSKVDCEDASLSLSTLRRKLFFQEDDPRHVHNASPVYNLHNSAEDNFELTPSSACSGHLSSSPMTDIKRTSKSPLNSLSPPSVSPISNSYSLSSSIEQNRTKNYTVPSIIPQITTLPAPDATDKSQKVLSYVEMKSTCVDEVTNEGTLFTSTLPTMSSDLGYHTYRSTTSDDTESNKIQPATLFPVSPKGDDFRMSWAPVQFSTPAQKQCQDAMSIDTSITC